MTRADLALQALIEDSGLREDLTDDEAAPLLAWAQAQLLAWDAADMDDASYEAQMSALRRLLRSLNQAVGQHSYASAQAHAEQLARASAEAQTLGLAALNEPTLAQAQGGAYMQALLAQLQPVTPAQPASPAMPGPDDDLYTPDAPGEEFE